MSGAAEIVAIGGDLEPSTLIAAYSQGIFPMKVEDVLAWWSPDPRGILPLDGFRLSRSLRRALPRFEIRVDTAFPAVMRACGDPRRPHGWIDDDFLTAYCRLHDLGWAHSIETWQGEVLAGGVYGVRVGRLFAGESMFHRPDIGRDASKVALVALVRLLQVDGVAGRLLDVQWQTPHLESLGTVELPRRDYLSRLDAALRLPAPLWSGPPEADRWP